MDTRAPATSVTSHLTPQSGLRHALFDVPDTSGNPRPTNAQNAPICWNSCFFSSGPPVPTIHGFGAPRRAGISDSAAP
jgi:hypothetical protein